MLTDSVNFLFAEEELGVIEDWAATGTSEVAVMEVSICRKMDVTTAVATVRTGNASGVGTYFANGRPNSHLGLETLDAHRT